MPRIRSIKPDTWKSEKVAPRLPGPDGRQARLLWIAMWNFAEDHGVIRGNPRYLLSELFPYDEDLAPADVERWLQLLEGAGRILRFTREGLPYIWIKGFEDHQKIDKPNKNPALPSPTKEERTSIRRTLAESSANVRGAFAVGVGIGVGGEGSGGEPAPNESAPAPQAARPPSPSVRPPQDYNAVAIVEETFQAATGKSFDWGPTPNGPEERALRTLAGTKSAPELREFLRLAFDPAFPSFGSLTKLTKAGIANELATKAAKLRKQGAGPPGEQASTPVRRLNVIKPGSLPPIDTPRGTA